MISVFAALMKCPYWKGAQLFGTRFVTDPTEDLLNAGRGECFPGQASKDLRRARYKCGYGCVVWHTGFKHPFLKHVR
eukprot:360194-Chlamydomonas_euryale.AAC.1